ncbi:beta galactosidase jelly roll domain-containing protein [Mucilaginibacter sp. RS28]|uniref:Beta galactosidase jelly roll domain-containing protein n=1 Tax=Mucilaginibacter straminoryzae TaxID=2932774 RepID=A0A9X1X0R9_9SPHI|nr:glycoside hydrolase family 2 TIM barrel-domain containing protein [Mucilaginibacter straminoryzae]MCJ8209122.1 beta galactosidase jelly roll domain-containing protein [Mucilaginibacter straminoryzae]
MKQLIKYAFLLISITTQAYAQDNLITNIASRKSVSLNGSWQYIADPYETGFYDYRYTELKESNPDAYWNTDVPSNKTEKKEHGYTDKYSLQVPGDWNHQKPEFLYYEGTLWYKKSFDVKKINTASRYFIYFGAVNYRADVYLNGKKLGMHIGGFTPFNFEIPAALLKENGNFLVVRVDNKRGADEVPTLNTDWWNYGGITRDVKLVEEPQTFIQDYFLQLKKPLVGKAPAARPEAEGWVKLNNWKHGEAVVISIPELKFKKRVVSANDSTALSFSLPKLQLWSPENPKLYRVVIATATDTVVDKIGFRTIQAAGKQVLLNGKPIFMRGICIHGEIPDEVRRAVGPQDARILLNRARELGCNMVRLAHYPHDEAMTRMTDSLGLLVWSEIPVYWTINFSNEAVLQKAKAQLKEMITRDHNKASVIIWSVGNETPISDTRTRFMHSLITTAKRLDSTRMISAALEVNYAALKSMNVIDDPLGQYVDVVSFNEYLGWYGGLPDQCRKANWSTPYNKPLFISETGADAKGGFHADSLTRFSEEYQEWYYKEQLDMLKRMPDNFVGISPWVLNDFRSPKRNNPLYQEGWNRKGLYDDKGNKKKAFYLLQSYYKEIKARDNRNK